ncbi:HAMP domain-containing histidine kinase [Methylobacterium sp. W2]|nr:HAMP domain-containing histidine kinase [Methylobacterium sp. W2]
MRRITSRGVSIRHEGQAIMKSWLARWDVTPAEQAGLTFGEVLTLVNIRRVEIACMLGLFTKAIEFATGLRTVQIVVEIVLAFAFLIASLALRRGGGSWLLRGFVAIFLVLTLLDTQWAIAAMGAKGRLTSGYPMMLLSLTLLFVLPPLAFALTLIPLLLSYCWIVLATATFPAEQVIAIVNAAIVSVIAVVAAALIHSGRRSDYEQKRTIRLQNDRLTERNSELDTLMAITAHDLRSPLYGLRNLFDLAVRRAPREPELPLVVLREAKASIDAMLGLATRLLEAHAAEHRPLARLANEDVRRHVLAAVDRIQPLAQSADVRIEADLPDRPLIATLDTGALSQILDNLLSNGVRFSPTGGILTIGATRDGGSVAIEVRDRGPGIDPAGYDLLFKKFHQAAGARSEGAPSTGMGLFIVATLADRMGAAVRCEPATQGGAVFVVTLSAGEE